MARRQSHIKVNKNRNENFPPVSKFFIFEGKLNDSSMEKETAGSDDVMITHSQKQRVLHSVS